MKSTITMIRKNIPNIKPLITKMDNLSADSTSDSRLLS